MVSVIINTVNENKDTLLLAVNSYLMQGNCQIIVSTIEGDPCLNYLTGVEFAVVKKSDHPGKSPRGAYVQLNNALPLIKGDWFCYASGNDFATHDKLKKEVNLCIQYNKEVCYSSYIIHSGVERRRMSFFEYDYSKHLIGNYVSDCSMMSRRLVEKYLPYRLDLGNYAHWDSWLRIYEGEGNVFHYNPDPTWFYVQNPDDMHNIRKRSPELQAIADHDREKMLNLHR